MNADYYTGNLVRLGDENPKVMADAFSRWNRDSEYYRLLDTSMARLWSANKIKEWFEKDLENELPDFVIFSVRTLAEDKLIGFVAFEGINWINRDAYVAIGIGERDYWGKGYGSDAMRLILHYGFTRMNLHRVSLSVFEYNPRAIRSYEKCGFRMEGRAREAFQREGRRWDVEPVSSRRYDQPASHTPRQHGGDAACRASGYASAARASSNRLARADAGSGSFRP